MSVPAATLVQIRGLTLSPTDEELAKYLYSYQLNDLLISYLDLDLVSLKRRNLASSANILKVIDRKLADLLSTTNPFQQFAFPLKCLVLIRDRVVTESETLIENKKDKSDNDLSGSFSVPGDFMQSWMENSKSTVSNVHTSELQNYPKWAIEKGNDNELEFFRRLKNPLGLAKNLNAFYQNRKVRYDLFISSSESDNRNLPESMKNHSSFRCQLNVQLTNIESLYLTEVSFTSLPETISSAYGSNFIIFEPRVYGLSQYSESKFRITVEVPSANYNSAQSLVDTVNQQLQSFSSPTNDKHMAFMKFGNSSFTYNNLTNYTKVTTDFGLTFHQDSFRFIWTKPSVCTSLGFDSQLQSSYSFCSIETKLVRSNNVRSTRTIQSGKIRVRYYFMKDWTIAYEQELQLATPSSSLLSSSQTFTEFVADVQTRLGQDPIFGPFSSFIVTSRNEEDGGGDILKLTLKPDVAQLTFASSIRNSSTSSTWWNDWSTVKQGGIQMEILFLDADDRKNIWFGTQSFCGFLPTKGETADLAIDSESVCLPNLFIANNRYQSLAYNSDPSPPSTTPGYPTFASLVAKLTTGSARKAKYHSFSSNQELNYIFVDLTNEVYLVDFETSSVVRQATTGVLLTAIDPNYRWLDEFIEISSGQQFTFSTLVSELSLKIQQNSRLNRSSFNSSETNSDKTQWKIDYVHTIEGLKTCSQITAYDLDHDKHKNLDYYPTLASCFHEITSDELTSKSTAFLLYTKGGLNLNSEYYIGRLRLVATPSGTSPMDEDVQGAELVIEDTTKFTDINAMLRALNAYFRLWKSNDFGNVWGTTTVEIASYIANATVSSSLVTLLIKANANKFVTESNFDLKFIGDKLWKDLGFPDSPTFRLANYLVDEKDSSGTISIGQKAWIESPSNYLKLVSVKLLPTANDVIVSYGANEELKYMQVARIEGIEPGVIVPANDPLNLYSFSLLLPVEVDLSVEMIVSELNAQLMARFHSSTSNLTTGRWGTNCLFSVIPEKSTVQFTGIFAQHFDSRDYDMIVYNTTLFSKCFRSRSAGVNTTFRFTLGYILGFQKSLQYDLTQYFDETTNQCVIEGNKETGYSLVNNQYMLVINDFTDSNSSTQNVVSTATSGTDSANYDTSISTLPSYVKIRRQSCDQRMNPSSLEESARLYIEMKRTRTSAITQKQLYNAIVQVRTKWERQNNVQSIEQLLSLGGEYSYTKGELRGNVPTLYWEKQSNSLQIENHVFAILYFSAGIRYQTYELQNAPLKRDYPGPKKLRSFEISLKDQYGNLVPLTNPWSLKLVAFGYPEDPYKSTLSFDSTTTIPKYTDIQGNRDEYNAKALKYFTDGKIDSLLVPPQPATVQQQAQTNLVSTTSGENITRQNAVKTGAAATAATTGFQNMLNSSSLWKTITGIGKRKREEQQVNEHLSSSSVSEEEEEEDESSDDENDDD